MRGVRWALGCVFAAATVAVSLAGAVEDAAQSVLDAVKSGDRATFRAAAQRTDMDPWVVAVELCRRGEFDAAKTFAAEVTGKDGEKLPAYIESRRGKPVDPRIKEAILAAKTAALQHDDAAALKALEGVPTDESDAQSASLLTCRAQSLGNLHRDESPATWIAAGESARKFGWWMRAAQAFRQGGLDALARDQNDVGLKSWTAFQSIAEIRGDRSGVADALQNIGICHEGLNDLPKALDFLQRALALKKELGDAKGAAGALLNIGNLKKTSGDVAGALEVYRQVLKDADAAGDRKLVAGAHASIARVMSARGELANAIGENEAAIAIYVEIGSPPETATALMNLGAEYTAVGEYDKAERRLAEARKLFESAGDQTGLVKVLSNLATLASSRGDLAQSAEMNRAALDAARKVGDRYGEALILGNLGELQARLGRGDEALAAQEQALTIWKDLGNRSGEGIALGNIALVHGFAGRNDRSLEYWKQAVAISADAGPEDVHIRHLWGTAGTLYQLRRFAESVEWFRRTVGRLDQMYRGLPDESAASVRQRWSNVYGLGLAAAVMAGSDPDVYWFMESGRAGALLESLGARPKLGSSAIPEALAAAERDARARDGAARKQLAAAMASRKLTEIKTARDQFAAAEDALGAAVARIQREAKVAADVLYPQPAPLADIQGGLGPTEALVLYAVVPSRQIALVITSKATRTLKIGAPEDVASVAEAFSPSDAAEAADESLAAFTAAVVDPLQLDPAIRRVYVSPTGPLSYAPFAAAMPDREIVYVPSATTWSVLRAEKAAKGKRVLALGDPMYEAVASGGPRAAGPRLERLPGSGVEAKAVGDDVLLRGDATESNLVRHLAKETRWRAVHFACHGIFDPSQPGRSSLAITPEGGGDGMLTTLGIFGMRIPADLVALSACETARGKVYTGEGVLGLTRAFMLAGAPRVLVSLWKVDDDATQALMKKFYENWRAGAAAADSLRRAQEFVRSQEKWKHPAYWSAWQLWGLGD